MSAILSSADSKDENTDSLNQVTTASEHPEELEVRRELRRGLARGDEILLPINGLEDRDARAKEVVQYAISMAKKFRMKIVLLYAIPNVELSDEYIQYAKIEGITDYYSSYLESISAESFSRWTKVLRAEGVEFETMTYVGSLNRAIRDASEFRSIGLVISTPGSRPRIGLIQRIFGHGNISYKVSDHSGVPVLSVP
ncbi:MAG TPA: universal stress protein [Nitrososphaerales archaeon]|nr:universal stress protein [Nitrososphaerales archaeon]